MVSQCSGSSASTRGGSVALDSTSLEFQRIQPAFENLAGLRTRLVGHGYAAAALSSESYAASGGE